MTHSVLIPHRNRNAHLTRCTAALREAANAHEVQTIVADQSDVRPDYEGYMLRPPFTPPFWKSKLLNFASKDATGELLTVLDVDCTVPLNFFSRIEETFASTPSVKLAHRVKLLNQRGEVIGQAAEHYNGRLWGCAMFTIPLQTFMDVNGYDERFRGFGLEDYELNGRLDSAGIKTVIRGDNDLHHYWHRQTPDWRSEESELRNRGLFIEAERNGFPPISRRVDWGCFVTI